MTKRDVIQHEEHALANELLGRRDMPRVLETRILWHEENTEVPPRPPGEGSGVRENSAAPPSPDDLPEDDTGESPCLPG